MRKVGQSSSFQGISHWIAPNLRSVEQEASVVPLLLHGLQLLAIERYECGHPLSVQQSLVSKASWSSGLFSHSNCSPFLVTLVGFSVIICAGLLRRMRYAG